MTDTDHLQNARDKQQLLRDRVAGLVQRRATGLLVYGPGGIGKSYVVDEELKFQDVGFKRITSHITPLALYRTLQLHREEILVFEDCESLLRSTISLGILRAATFPSGRDRQGNPIRTVDYHHGHKAESFIFNGRIILLMNRGLADIPEAVALATRISCIEYNLSNAEIAALMRDAASRDHVIGGHRVAAAECLVVVDFLIGQASEAGRQLNLRMLDKALADFLQDDDNQSGLTWRDLVTSDINQQPMIIDPVSKPQAREQRHRQELELARSLLKVQSKDRERIWKEKSGRSRATYYRRFKELAAMDNKMFKR